MNIKLLIDAKMIGGVEIHVMNLYEELSKLNHNCQIIFINHYPDNILHTLCNKRSINYHTCKSYKEVYTKLSKDKPDIIHTHGYKANIIGRLLGILLRIPIFSTFHTGEKPKGRLILYNSLDKWSSFLSHNICVNSIIASQLPFKAIIIPNFVSIPPIQIIKKSEPYNIFFIGRFSQEKGPLRFCELTSKSQNINWHMVGIGPLFNICQEKYHQNIHFHGEITDMETIWSQVDLLCITSTAEGLPLVLLEAMSRGIPVVAFDVGSIREVQTHGEYIIEPYNTAKMKQCVLSHFSKTIEEQEEMAHKARDQIISIFSKDVVVPKIEEYYKRAKIN